MREKFSSMLADAALNDNRILLLTGDHGYALFDEFRSKCPDQFINCGIAEQNMVGVAAGLAKAGFKPIVYGLSAFVPIRVAEQIKMDICYEKLPVIFIGDGAGIVYGQLGPSHQSTEDLAVVAALPNIDIYAPCDRAELQYCFSHMLKFERPNYFRFGKADCGDVHTEIPSAPIGDLLSVKEAHGKKIILAHGSMVTTALAVANRLQDVAVWSVPSIKPLNLGQLRDVCAQHENVYVLEEHSRHGGLGSMVASALSETGGQKVVTIGIDDKFSGVCGDYKFLMKYHCLDEDTIFQKIYGDD